MGLCAGKKARAPRRVKHDNSEDIDYFHQKGKSGDTKDFSQNESEDNKDFQQDNVILRHYDFLVDRMSPEFGLIDKLYSNGTLSEQQYDEIEAASVGRNRNKNLLKYIVQENACDKLFQALKECGQSHLVKYMEADGVYKTEFGGNWLLPGNERTLLIKNHETLIDLLDCSDLVGLLYQTGVLNKQQRDLVSSKVTTAEQNKVLLEILRRGSLVGYWQAIRCLHLTNQSHIAKIIESRGVVVRIDANLHSRSSNLPSIENSIVAEVTNLLSNTSFSDAERIWEEVKLNLLAVAAKHSVSLYFLCNSKGDIDRLKKMASNGQLKEFVEDLFNRLIKCTKRIKVTLKWSKQLFSESREYIEAIKVENVIYEPMKTTIQCLPLELLDTTLQNVYLWFILQSGAWNGVKDSDIFVLLASVGSCWLQRILRKRLKQRIWPQLEKIYKREFEMYFSFTGCQCYLEEAIQVEAIMQRRNEMLAAECFTDLQIERILRIKLSKDKKGNRRGWPDMTAILAEEIFPMRRGFERESMHEDFISFLRRTNQTLAARVLEQEGRDENYRIRNSKDIHLEEISQLKTASIRDRSIKLDEKLQTQKYFHWVTGVTKLRNLIFVLGQSRPSNRDVLYVFDDQHPFRLQRKITLEEIESAMDISSFEKNFCLYITDYGENNNCIWKIRFPDDDKIKDREFTGKVLKCLEFSNRDYYRMTITNEGHLVIIDGRAPVLLFYESESALNDPIRIDLPDEIEVPLQVAVNSVGNFIISYYTKVREKYYAVISEVDRNGKTIIRQYFGTRDRWINRGERIVFHRDSKDRVILADTIKSRLIFLDSRLRYLRSFITYFEGENGEKYPFHPISMFYDGGKNQVIVAERNKVFVHSFSSI